MSSLSPSCELHSGIRRVRTVQTLAVPTSNLIFSQRCLTLALREGAALDECQIPLDKECCIRSISRYHHALIHCHKQNDRLDTGLKIAEICACNCQHWHLPSHFMVLSYTRASDILMDLLHCRGPTSLLLDLNRPWNTRKFYVWTRITALACGYQPNNFVRMHGKAEDEGSNRG